MDKTEVPEHGDRVKDSITGYTGIIIGITDWLFGCKHVAVKREGLDKEGRPQESKSFDIQRVEVVKKNAVPIMPAPRPEEFVECGDEVQCLITKLKGIAVGVTHWDSECAVYIQPQSIVAEGEKAGMPTPDSAIVETQLKIVKKAAVKRPSFKKAEKEEELETVGASSGGRNRAKEDKEHPGGPADEVPKVIR